MKLSADHIFHIGSQHLRGGTPCQDYALSGAMDGGVYAVVSDGCSTGRRTDVGARVVALSTARAITNSAKANMLTLERINMLQPMMMDNAEIALDLDLEDLLATRALAYATPDWAEAHLAGDGVIAARRRDGSIYMARVDWANNMPFYPAYRDEALNRFIRAHGGDVDSNVVKVTIIGGDELPQMEVSLRFGLRGLRLGFHPLDTEYLAVFSDGVTQVDGIEWDDAVRQLLAFKSPAGDFAKRRMNGFLKHARDVGKGPVDDIAYAVIHIDAEPA